MTGTTGFIGRHAAAHLVGRGWVVHALERDPGRVPHGVVAHRNDGSLGSCVAALDRSGADAVVHLAALFIKDHASGQVGELIDANIRLTAILLEAMSQVGTARLVMAGTAWQHAQASTGASAPANLYAATKEAAEGIARWYAASRSMRTIALHLGDTYGPGDKRRKVFDLIAEAARDGTPLELSPGGQRLDPLHVSDAASAIEVAIQRTMDDTSAPFETFRVSPGLPRTLRELAELWCRLHGVTPDLRWGARPYRQAEVMEPWVGGTVLPGWRPRVGVEQGFVDIHPGKGVRT